MLTNAWGVPKLNPEVSVSKSHLQRVESKKYGQRRKAKGSFSSEYYLQDGSTLRSDNNMEFFNDKGPVTANAILQVLGVEKTIPGLTFHPLSAEWDRVLSHGSHPLKSAL